jgi:hypothetical protein
MKQRAWLALAALGVAVVACFVLLQEGGSAPPLPSAGPAPAPVPAGEAAVGATSGTAAPAAAGERLSLPASSAFPAASPPIPDDALWVDVLVVDKATQQPVPGADAVWDDGSSATGRNLSSREVALFWRERDQLAGERGWRGRTDAAGRLRVHVGNDLMQVFVRAGSRYGEGHWTRTTLPPGRLLRVELEEDRTLFVRVRDAAGAPAAGVPVSLHQAEPDATERTSYGGERPTDAAGLVAFRHVQALQVWPWGRQLGQPVEEWLVYIELPGLDLPPLRVDAQAPPHEPIEVQLPPTGRLRARVTLDGAAVPGLDRLGLHVDPQQDRYGTSGICFARMGDDGWARFPYVPLGKTFFLTLRVSGGECSWPLAGPTRPHEEAVVAFELAPKVVSVVGRVLDEHGQPVVGDLVAEFETIRARGRTTISTDGFGRFAWLLRHSEKAPLPQTLSRLRLDLARRDAPMASVEVPPRELLPGRNDLGDLRLATAPLVVGGRFEWDSPGPGRASFAIEQHIGRHEPEGDDRWETVRDVQTISQDDGAFAVRGTVPPGRYRLRLSSNEHLPVEPVEFAPGAADLTIRLQRGHRVEASVLAPAGITANRLRLRLERAAESAEPPATSLRRGSGLVAQQLGHDDGAFRYVWPTLPAGRYTLSVEPIADLPPYEVLDDVLVPVPEGGDGRLLRIDLRERIAVLRVRVELPAGTSASLLAFPEPQRDPQDWHGFAIERGQALLPLPAQPVDLLFVGAGLRPVRVPRASGELTLRMEPWPAVELRLRGAGDLPPGVELRALTQPLQPLPGGIPRFRTEDGRGTLEQYLLAADAQTVRGGTATVRVGDGVWRLVVHVALEPAGQAVALHRTAPQQIVAGPPVDVLLSAEEVAAAIAALPAGAGMRK